jgi:hypothetical protein
MKKIVVIEEFNFYISLRSFTLLTATESLKFKIRELKNMQKFILGRALALHNSIIPLLIENI